MTTRSQTSLLLSAREEFHRSFAPESFRSGLRQSQGESAWKLLHSGSQLNPSEFPTPASSEYHLPLASRPRSAGISQFTARQNRRLEDKGDLASTLLPTSLGVSNSTKILRSPTEKDYQRMIDRLQKLQSGNVGNRRIVLTELKDEEVMLDADEVQYFKVQTLGKMCPLKVTVEREKGSIIVYMSRTEPEPADGASDEVYKKDTFTISDTGLRFKTDCLYLAAKALNQTNFTVEIKFGKRVSSSESNFRSRKEAERQELDARLEDLRKVIKPKPQIHGTNFIKKNLEVVPFNSPKMKRTIKLKKKQAQERRQVVLVRKQTLLAEKRQRTFLVLHRHELRLEAEAKAREILELIERKESFEKAWFLLIVTDKFVEGLNDRFQKRKQELAHAAKLNRAAIVIQKCFRKFITNLDKSGLALRISRNGLLLFARLRYESVRLTATKNILSVIHQAYKNSILPVAASRMLNRSNVHAVALIKRVWKWHLEKRKRRWDELLSLWSGCLDEILGDLQKAQVKTKGRASRKKKDPAVKYMEITTGQRTQALTTVMLNARRRYRDLLHSYISSQHELMRKGIKAMLGRDGSLALLALPGFTFLPTREEMKTIIHKLVGVVPATQSKKAR